MWLTNGAAETTLSWPLHHSAAAQRVNVPSVRTGLLMWLGGLAPCTLTALTTNWYSVSGSNPFKTMELVSMGSRIYVHSVSISGLWNDKTHKGKRFRFCLVFFGVSTCRVLQVVFILETTFNMICFDMFWHMWGMFNLIVFLLLMSLELFLNGCKVQLWQTSDLNNSNSGSVIFCSNQILVSKTKNN